MTALDGIRVLDLTRLLPGPLGSLVLADLGATVDKVEDRGAGDYLRATPPQKEGQSVAFHALNRGKRGLILDLKHADGPAALKRLVKGYDVLFEQFRPGVLDRLGVGHQTLLAEHPGLVICALTGYGQTGPLANRAGHDLNYIARAGILGLQGPEDGQPFPPGFQLADVSGGLWSVIGILAALRERDRTGAGQVVDISMNESVIPFATAPMARTLGGEPVTRGGEVLTGGAAAYQTYETQDGKWVALAALEPKFLQKFFTACGMETDLSAIIPGPHQPALKAKLAEVFKTKTRDEWAKIAADADCMLEPVLTPEELKNDEHLASRNVFCDIETSEGPMGQYRTPVTPRDLEPSLGPSPGQHTDEILSEAGFSSDEISALRDSGVIG